MNIPFLKGNFTQSEALDILTQLVHVKIKFHESKIEKSDNEEDIKMRENRIKNLLQDFYEAKQLIIKQKQCDLNAEINIG
ncbi:hypothetical protein [Runella aurantiaca]|uniref:Uncharacterized protein n=1 Tax=Runella aurantiaca TaxID=2282308 RepID=A0A369II72_9BACT|nr:hypothetical protein [Runella aurantiaca]RDB06954.1 hypothetical protein DVG78_06660 [Runella aurantiaca]